MPNKDEQETTVTWNAADTMVHIYSSVPKHLARLRKDRRFKEVGDLDAESAFFIGPLGIFDPLDGIRRARKPMTPEAKLAAATRLQSARDKRNV